MNITQIDGLADLIADLQTLASMEGDRSLQGALTEAALFVQKQAQKNAPVDLGNLKASAFTVTEKMQDREVKFRGDDADELQKIHKLSVSEARELLEGMSAVVGFGARYAAAVHELHETKGKFLEKAFSENRERILEIIAKHLQKEMKR